MIDLTDRLLPPISEEEQTELIQAISSYRPKIEELARRSIPENIDNIVFLGMGGTLLYFEGLEYAFKKYCKLPIYSANCAIFGVESEHRYITPNSLVVTYSISGNTEEVVGAMDTLLKEGVKVVSFTGNETSAIAERSAYHMCAPDIMTVGRILPLIYLLAVLRELGSFSIYENVVDSLEGFIRGQARTLNERRMELRELAHSLRNEPYIMVVGSGALYPALYSFAMCELEECQWLRTRCVRSEEFFHGPLELVEDEVPVLLFKGLDNYRALDERVERFCCKFTNRLHVFDLAEMDYGTDDPRVKDFLVPLMVENLCLKISYNLEDERAHPLLFRRYYRRFDY